MRRFLYAHKVRIFDDPRFAAMLRDVVRGRAAALAAHAGIARPRRSPASGLDHRQLVAFLDGLAADLTVVDDFRAIAGKLPELQRDRLRAPRRS